MTTLKDLYIEEVQDLWSANNQMAEVIAARKIDAALDRIYESDHFMTELAERSRNLDAAA